MIPVRTRVTVWFAVVAFAYSYKAVLCGFVSHTLGLEFVCEPLVRGISVNHWIEILLYCPLLWLALRQINADVFGDPPATGPALRSHRRRMLIGEAAIAAVLYGTGVHIVNVVEIYTREEQGIASGEVYDLVYFLDEGLSHYLQFIPLFFVIGWFVIHDRPARVAHSSWAVFLGVGHGVERAVGIIEGGKWFLGPPTVLWFVVAVALRVRRRGSDAWAEFFVRYAATFCVSLPVAQLVYRARFGSFGQPSSLGDARLAEVALGAAVLIAVGTAAALAAERVARNRLPLASVRGGSRPAGLGPVGDQPVE